VGAIAWRLRDQSFWLLSVELDLVADGRVSCCVETRPPDVTLARYNALEVLSVDRGARRCHAFAGDQYRPPRLPRPNSASAATAEAVITSEVMSILQLG
jgi:hypothetical protein